MFVFGNAGNCAEKFNVFKLNWILKVDSLNKNYTSYFGGRVWNAALAIIP